MNLWRKFTNMIVEKSLTMGKGAVLKVTSDAGVVSNVSISELAVLDGLLATADELNRSSDVSTRVVSSTAATITVTLASHENKVVVLASTHTQTITLPAASGSGARYRFLVNTTGTDGSKVIKVANTLDVMTGVCASHSTATNQASSFLTSATSDTITFDNTTTGGITGTQVEVLDIAANQFLVRVDAAASGSVATPFSAGV